MSVFNYLLLRYQRHRRSFKVKVFVRDLIVRLFQIFLGYFVLLFDQLLVMEAIVEALMNSIEGRLTVSHNLFIRIIVKLIPLYNLITFLFVL